MITLELTQDEVMVLGNLLDGAARHYGKAASKSIAHFDDKISDAVKASNSQSNVVPIDKHEAAAA